MAQSQAQSTVEKWWRQSLEYSINSNDALVTLLAKGFETILVVLSPASCNARIDRAITSLDSERTFALQFENKDFDIIRHLCFCLIESLQVLLEVKGKDIEEKNQTLVDEAPNASLRAVEPKEEPIDPIDHILEGNQLPIVDDFVGESLFKEEEIVDFGANNPTPTIENPLYEVPSNDEDTHGNIVPADMMGDDMKFMEDPIMDSTPIEEETLNNVTSSNVENVVESAQTELIGEANVEMEEEVEKDNTVRHTTDTSKDSSETGKVAEKMRPRRTSSRPVNYTEFIDESEPPVKKPNIKPNCDKKFHNKRKSGVDESSSKQSSRAVRVTKINHTELECPNCEYRSPSVYGWYKHLYNIHSTNPRVLGLALLCECGSESFSAGHGLQCEISKITIVRKSATPQCLLCEVHPKTALGYVHHLQVYHKTTLKQMGIFLICSCGHKFSSHKSNSEHTKKCNGHEFTLHKLDEE